MKVEVKLSGVKKGPKGGEKQWGTQFIMYTCMEMSCVAQCHVQLILTMKTSKWILGDTVKTATGKCRQSEELDAILSVIK